MRAADGSRRLSARAVRDAFGEAETNLVAYQVALQDEARRRQARGDAAGADAMQALADRVNIEETRVAHALRQLDAVALLSKLQDQATDLEHLRTIVNEVGKKTKELKKSEDMVKWVLGVVSGIATIVASVPTGGLPSALLALGKLLAAKPE